MTTERDIKAAFHLCEIHGAAVETSCWSGNHSYRSPKTRQVRQQSKYRVSQIDFLFIQVKPAYLNDVKLGSRPIAARHG
jgi:hypothetical protein